MRKLKQKHRLRLTKETLRELRPDLLSRVVAGMIVTQSWCLSERDTCTGSDHCTFGCTDEGCGP